MTNETNRNLTSAPVQEKTTEPESTPLTDEQLQQVAGGALDACMKL